MRCEVKEVSLDTPKRYLGNFKASMEYYEDEFEFYRTSESRKYESGWTDYWGKVEDPRWVGIESAELAKKYLLHGWEDKMEEAVGIFNGIKPSFEVGSRQSFENRVQGFAPVVPLALMGVPNCMIANVRKAKRNPVLKVVYDMGATGNVSAKTLMEMGLKVIAELYALEKAGWRIDLSVARFQGGRNFSDGYIIPLKKPGQPFDLKRLMFPMCHPGFFRCLGLGWKCRKPEPITDDLGSSIGHYHTEENQDRIAEAFFGKDVVYISAQYAIDSPSYLDGRFARLQTVSV